MGINEFGKNFLEEYGRSLTQFDVDFGTTSAGLARFDIKLIDGRTINLSIKRPLAFEAARAEIDRVIAATNGNFKKISDQDFIDHEANLSKGFEIMFSIPGSANAFNNQLLTLI